jgi:Ca2+-binding EF-hand superfamily protein
VWSDHNTDSNTELNKTQCKEYFTDMCKVHQYDFEMSEDVWDQIFTMLDTDGNKSISMDEMVDFL